MWLLEGGEGELECLIVAYGLEEGSRRFYRDLAGRGEDPEVDELFALLADVEEGHEDRLWERYRAAGGPAGRDVLAGRLARRAVEGGETADQVLARWGRFPLTVGQALDLAMALETDSLDLYLRLAEAVEGDARPVFLALAREERDHLGRLGTLRGRRSES